jgi:hypothetical protein
MRCHYNSNTKIRNNVEALKKGVLNHRKIPFFGNSKTVEKIYVKSLLTNQLNTPETLDFPYIC